ncbi:type II toxin-antitoxin system RelE/ParE family toxin [Rhizobium sp. 2YAF20]|uniref:type II toxin-antitoxin system RelE/ParE family toxin n=1 Tax=Rhizobium sp. 2YAF20 TaxID=3233027 RepID=UPI003F9469D1
MAYRIIYHPRAEAELDALYADIATEVGDRIAGKYVDGVMTFIEGLEAFPQRGRKPDSRLADHRLQTQR